MGVIISVVNQKGGVGKTTSAVNISAALARMGYKTLLLDFDPQGHSTEHLGINKSAPNSVLEFINRQTDIAGAAIKSYIPNLSVLPADLRLGQFNQNPPQGMQFALKNVLSPEAIQNYDFVLIDCQPSLSLLTLNALTASDYVVLPVQAEFFALDGLTQLVLTLREVRTKLNPKLSVLGIAITMFDRRNKLSDEIRAELQKSFGKDLFQTYIPRSVRLAEAPSFGQSIFEYAGGSAAAKSYELLTEEILAKLNYLQAAESLQMPQEGV